MGRPELVFTNPSYTDITLTIVSSDNNATGMLYDYFLNGTFDSVLLCIGGANVSDNIGKQCALVI